MDLTVVAKIREFFGKINKASDPQNKVPVKNILLVVGKIKF